MFVDYERVKRGKVNMETQDYAFEPGLDCWRIIKSSQKDWQDAINHRFVKELLRDN